MCPVPSSRLVFFMTSHCPRAASLTPCVSPRLTLQLPTRWMQVVHRGQGLAVVGRDRAWVALTPVMIASYRIGRKAVWAFPLLAASCRCKAKTSVFLNAQLSPPALRALDQSGYGAHSIIMQDTQLGLQLLGRYGLSPAGWTAAPRVATLASAATKARRSIQARLSGLRMANLSVRARALYVGSFVSQYSPIRLFCP